MLARRRETLSSALVCFCLVVLASSASAADLATKLDRAKRADHDGYAPQRLARVATVTEIEPNDAVGDAQSVAVGDQVDASLPVGDVDWFLVDASAEAYVTVSTTARGGSLTDTLLDVFTADGATLLASDDDGGLGLYSALQSLDGGSVLAVRVTRFSSVGDEDYALVVEAAGPPPATPTNDTPAAAEVLGDCNTVANGTTVGASDALAGATCLPLDVRGGDVFYRLEVPYSYQLIVHLEPDASFDPAAMLFGDPADPDGSCIVAVDEAFAGEQETLLFTNEDASSPFRVVYLAVDSWDPQRAGAFTAVISCDFVVSDDTHSFGGLKARF